MKNRWQQRYLDLEVTHPDVQTLANQVEEWGIRLFRREACLLVIHGPPGTGKTRVLRHLATFCREATSVMMERRVFHEVPGVSYAHWPTLVDDMKQGAYGLVEDLINDDMVFLDDLGAEHDPSKSAANKLCQILTHRQESRWTAVSTNFPPEQWREHFDSRIADRLCRNSLFADTSLIPSYSGL